ncbi:MAG: macro domain-containing protein [Verrucomicrobia bacterium]|nr:macro domain-containing protein [Verrucomicrobiota bacterium]MCH8512981.1 macro domain-containing protein [Kiritimatiellia bacterium]
MITYKQGNLLKADAEALVNTVNCVGVMGKGIALQFKQAFPDCFKAYKQACDREEVQPGRMQVHDRNSYLNPRYIINFPTKRHWKGKSRMEDVESGLVALRDTIFSLGIHSVAVPPLGCGNGGLEWSVVRARIEEVLGDLPGVEVQVFEPAGAPENKQMPVQTKAPRMTRGRAALLLIFQKYLQPGYELTMLEIQKLAYFLQEAGEPLKLEFQKQKYGPYAETLHHVLQRIEGHFVRGYGDRSRDASVDVFDEAMAQAETYLENEHPDALRHAETVEALIEGFETPFGLELLSTVDWVLKHEDCDPGDEASVMAAVHGWNQRKSEIFSSQHIRVALNRLREVA